MAEPLMSIEELAARLAVPVDTIYGWRRRRNRRGGTYGPPAMRIGKHLRWDPKDVTEWLTEQKAA